MLKKFIDAVFPDKLEQMCKTEKGSLLKGILILALGVLLSNIIFIIGQLLLVTGTPLPGEVLYLTLLPVLVSALTRAIVSFFGLLIVFFLLHLIAKLVGGKGSFDQMLYMASMPYVLLSLIGSILELLATFADLRLALPCCTWIACLGMNIYGIYLFYIVLKTVHGIKETRQMVGILLAVALILGVLLVIVLMFVWQVLVGAAASHGRFGQ